MKIWHLILILFIGYMLAIYMPGPGQAIRAKIGI